MTNKQICLYAPIIGIYTALGVVIGDAISHGTHGLVILLMMALINAVVCWQIIGKRKAQS